MSRVQKKQHTDGKNHAGKKDKKGRTGKKDRAKADGADAAQPVGSQPGLNGARVVAASRDDFHAGVSRPGVAPWIVALRQRGHILATAPIEGSARLVGKEFSSSDRVAFGGVLSGRNGVVKRPSRQVNQLDADLVPMTERPGREELAYLFSETYDWRAVPQVVMREIDGEKCSVQIWKEGLFGIVDDKAPPPKVRRGEQWDEFLSGAGRCDYLVVRVDAEKAEQLRGLIGEDPPGLLNRNVELKDGTFAVAVPKRMIDRADFEKMRVMDFILGNIDRVSGNVALRLSEDGRLHPVPVDHALLCPEKNPSLMNAPWGFFGKELEGPLLPETKAWIAQIQPEELAQLLYACGVSRNAAKLALLRLAALKISTRPIEVPPAEPRNVPPPPEPKPERDPAKPLSKKEREQAVIDEAVARARENYLKSNVLSARLERNYPPSGSNFRASFLGAWMANAMEDAKDFVPKDERKRNRKALIAAYGPAPS
jgi:hypothetical protein